MRLRITRPAWPGVLLTVSLAQAAAGDFVPLHERSVALLERLETTPLVAGTEAGEFVAAAAGLRIRQCGGYPYHERHDPLAGARALREDLVAGLRTGLACLSGAGPAGRLHRYRDRPALLFHEVVHWLGHQHSAFRPDLTHLYETCCFGGSDYISDPEVNAAHRETACAILRDDELWSTSYHPYKQMRIWHDKGYHRFKARMRADYDS